MTDRTKARLDLVRPLFSASLGVAVTDPQAQAPAPMAEEIAGLSPRAIDKRRREFAAGRHAVRIAMAQIGVPAAPVRVGSDRAPIWPDGIVGGLTHTTTCAIAVVGRRAPVHSIGVDVEEDTPLKEKLLSEICLPREQVWLASQADPLRLAKLIFSAKEAAYKAQYPYSRTVFGFSGMETEWDLAQGRFTARLQRDVAPFATGHRINGRFAMGQGILVTGVEMEAV
ncbi:4'-phosphopantetheinyl transferase superfamily protein [Aliisedimentitalea scapharcae]|uniref:Enterobactin synthase component D n=1 Tax=Aliisedimentitalea scapharcae TaxID=1524259 RepID=A0ABZ2XWC5_9RHOB